MKRKKKVLARRPRAATAASQSLYNLCRTASLETASWPRYDSWLGHLQAGRLDERPIRVDVPDDANGACATASWEAVSNDAF